MRKIIYLVILLSIGNNLPAQDTTSSKNSDLGFSIKACFLPMSLNALNHELKANSYPTLLNYGFKLSGAIIIGKTTSKMYDDIEVSVLKTGGSNSLGFKTTLLTSELSNNVYCNIYSGSQLQVHPFIGFGILTAVLKLSDNSKSNSFSNSFFSSPYYNKEIRSDFVYTFIVGAGINKSFRIKSIIISQQFAGLDIGYKLNLNKTEWISDNALTGVPDINWGGPFIRIVFGFY